MMRRCPWCGLDYDTVKESSVFCSSNPGASAADKRRAKKRIFRGYKPYVVTALIAPRSPFWPSGEPK